MTWRITGTRQALDQWVSTQAPSPVLVHHILVDWLPALNQGGPWQPWTIGEIVAYDPGTGLLMLDLHHAGVEGFFAEMEVDDEHHRAVDLKSISRGLAEPDYGSAAL